MNIVILTETRYEAAAATTNFVSNLLREDALLAQALQQQGCLVTRIGWDRPDYDWSVPRAAIFRSTWDYYYRFPEFLAWLERVAAHIPLINPATMIRWNANKTYLLDLQQRGLRIVETHLITNQELSQVPVLWAKQGWHKAIIKPAVSAGAWHTYLLEAPDISDCEQHLQTRPPHEQFLVQPFQHAIGNEGELSLIVIAGDVTHAVRKIAKSGDFRVQDDHGGTVHPHTPTSEEIAFAQQAVALCNPLPLYARVDMIRDNDGQLALMELELIEPELFFRFCPSAADRLAAAMVAECA